MKDTVECVRSRARCARQAVIRAGSEKWTSWVLVGAKMWVVMWMKAEAETPLRRVRLEEAEKEAARQ